MTQKNRHELPRKRPGRSAKDDIAEDLPELEPLAEDLPALEPIGDGAAAGGPVVVTGSEGGAEGFDAVLTIEVAAMDKQAVAAAVAAPLQRAVVAAPLRHRRVLVRFTGEAMIGSAVKELVASTLKPHAPLLAVVRRGFGDERVLEGRMPQVVAEVREHDGRIEVAVQTGELEAVDLPLALAPHLAAITARARDRMVVFAFDGKARPDATLRAQLAQALRDAGARRAAIGERVLFDRDLEERVRCRVDGDVATITIAPAEDEATTVDALSLVLPEHAGACKGRVVRIELARPADAARDFAVAFAQKHGATRIEAGALGQLAVVWPPLLTLAGGGEPVLRLSPHGRDRAAMLQALQAEAPAHAAATRGRAMVLDWPAGVPFDGEAESALQQLVAVLQPRALACTFGGEHREPFVPPPLLFDQQGGTCTVRIDSEAGKPVELQRAVERRLPAWASGLRGRAVRVQVAGAVALSRTLLRSVVVAVQAAGPARLEVEEGGAVDVLSPPMTAITRAGEVVRIAADAGGRDAAQQQKALQRELDAAVLPAGATIVVAPSPVADAVIAACIARGAARVTLDGPTPVPVHPPLLAAPERKGLQARIVVRPGGDEVVVLGQLDRELATWAAGLGAIVGAAVTVVWPGAAPGAPAVARLVQTLAGRRPGKVLLDAGAGAPVQVYPPTAAAPAPATAAGPAAAPAAASAPGAGLLALLGRRDDAVPPMIVLGVQVGTDPSHLAAVEAELQGHLPRLRGRSVLVVPRSGDRDVPVRKADALVDLLRRVVPATAAATLVFRGPDAQGRPHFQVLQSTLRALPVGAVFADPRTRA